MSLLLANCYIFVVDCSGLESSFTCVNGVLTSDDIWTKEKSPYLITNNLTIPSSVSLTIEAGVSVTIRTHSITVYGSLNVQGTQDEKVTFDNGTILLEPNGTSATIDNAVFTDSTSLILASGSPTISNCHVASRLIVKDGSPVISNNVLLDGVHADSKGGPVIVIDNQIGAKSGWAPVYVQGIHGDISGNIIDGNGTRGIWLPLAVTSGTITNNIIYNCRAGICAPDGNVEITCNVVFNCSTGVYVWGIAANLHNNTIRFNDVGVQCTHAVLRQNNICNNSQLNLENLWLARVDAVENWWGTTNYDSVQQLLYWNANYSGTVDYFPFLVSPNPSAPKIPDELLATPSPVPTASTTQNVTVPLLGFTLLQACLVVIVAGVIAVVIAMIVTYRRKHN